MTKTWWKEAIVYQIYPRSFKDSNGDGIGDLRGIIEKADYLAELGVNVVWMSPHFKSPNVDNGYDVSDYCDVMDEFGTMADFDELLAVLHQRGIKLIIDLVVNHSSDQHKWFQEAKKSKDNPYRDYYIWQKPKENGDPPNDWESYFSGSVWELDEASGEYYLHLFCKEQPDLNWENPQLREEVYNLMRFWLDKGVDGFRMDVIPLISKDWTFPNYPEGRFADLTLYANGARVHEFLQEMNEKVLRQYDCMTVGECFGVFAHQALDYIGEDRNELQTIYHFDHVGGREEHNFEHGWTEIPMLKLKGIFERWDFTIGDKGWNTIYFGNHDNQRVVSRFGNDTTFRVESAKMLATLLLTQRGTPYIYQGDEIGMTNCDFKDISEYNDVQVLNAYKVLVEGKGVSAQQFLDNANQIARDHARNPIPWTNEANGGFTSGTPWLKVNPKYPEINVADAVADQDSVFHYYHELIALRKANEALTYGAYCDLLPNHAAIWAYSRTLEDKQFIIVVNFYGNEEALHLPEIEGKTLLVSNYATHKDGSLQPYEARIYGM